MVTDIKTVLVLGANGFLGSSLVSQLRNYYAVYGGVTPNNTSYPNTNEVYIETTNKEKLLNTILGVRPDLIINCIGISNVDFCEKSPNIARDTIVNNLDLMTSVIGPLQIPFIHISTDQLFSKGENKLYSETDHTSPCNIYGKLKLEAEKIVSNNIEKSIIIRTNFFGYDIVRDISIADIIKERIIKDGYYSGFYDVEYTPVHTSTVCEVIKNHHKLKHQQIYNVASDEKITKANFAKLLCYELGLSTKSIVPMSIESLDFSAKRPKNMSLSNNKIRKILTNINFSLSHNIQVFMHERNQFLKNLGD